METPSTTPAASNALGTAVKDRTTAFVQRVLHPEEARIAARVEESQVALGRAAALHQEDLEATGHLGALQAILDRATALEELAEALDVTPVEQVPATPKAWERPNVDGFLAKMSRHTAAFLADAGDWLRDMGYRLEVGRCRMETKVLYSDIGAILAGIWGADAHAPVWAVGHLADMRDAASELEQLKVAGEDRPSEQLKRKMQTLWDRVGQGLNNETVKSAIDVGGSQARAGFTELTAWGLQTFQSFGLFVAVLSGIALLSMPWGPVILAGVVYTWVRYRPEVEARARGTQTVVGETDHTDPTVQ